MKERIKAIYANLNPDILAGIHEELTEDFDVNLTVYDIINEYFNKYPAADLEEAAEYLEDAESIGALEDYYEFIESLAEDAGIIRKFDPVEFFAKLYTIQK